VTVAADGWTDLWTGTSTRQFRGYGRPAFPADHWEVDGDAFHATPGVGVDLVTIDRYGDFELEFAWRVSPGGNSGVLYRVAETGDPAWTTGPEYQVLDDDRHPDGARPETSAGALYDLLAPAGALLLPVGEYNEGRIVLRSGRVEHWLNGVRVVEYGWADEAMRERVAASKFAAYDRFMREDRGHIVLQHHGEEAWFRSIRVRPFDGDDAT
jgi:hypothetical protein